MILGSDCIFVETSYQHLVQDTVFSFKKFSRWKRTALNEQTLLKSGNISLKSITSLLNRCNYWGQLDKSAKDRRVVLKLSMNTDLFFFHGIVTKKKPLKLNLNRRHFTLNKLLCYVPLNIVGLGFFVWWFFFLCCISRRWIWLPKMLPFLSSCVRYYTLMSYYWVTIFGGVFSSFFRRL